MLEDCKRFFRTLQRKQVFKMPIKAGMTSTDKFYEVQRLHGQSYAFTDMSIDGPDAAINEKIKKMQATEFEEVAKIRLFVQKERFRFKLMDEKTRVNEERCIEEEFKDFKLSDFVLSTFTEEELVDIIIDNKVEEIAEIETRKDRCCAWVLNHCK